MSTLYEIDENILQCIDGETGEIIDYDRLNALMLERNAKIESVALWVKNLKSDAAAYRAEKESFAEKERKATEKIEQLQRWLAMALHYETLHTEKVDVTFRKADSVVITSPDELPPDYWREKVEKVPDKKLIKEAIKNNKVVPGATVETQMHTHVN